MFYKSFDTLACLLIKIDLPESKFRITRSHLYDCRIFGIRQRRNIGWYKKTGNEDHVYLLPAVYQFVVFIFRSRCMKNKIKEIRNTKVDEQDLLVSFNVVSLFTKILVDNAIKIIKNITDEETVNPVKVCFQLLYFNF